MEKETNVDITEVSIQEPIENTENTEQTTDNQIAELNTQLNELNDKYLRLAAELENTRRRASLDAESRARNRAISVAEKILPIMDAINMAISHSPNDEGLKSISLALESAFAQIGITKIESIGQTLNPQFHNAIQVITPDEPDKTKPNTIVQELQTGYMFGDTVLRTAMVIVSK